MLSFNALVRYRLRDSVRLGYVGTIRRGAVRTEMLALEIIGFIVRLR